MSAWMRPRALHGGFLPHFLFSLAIVAVLLGGLEIAVRARQSRRLGPKSLHPQALRDRYTAWRNNPAYGRVDVHINAQGFRHEHDIPVEKPLGTVRVFFLGGSAAFGAGGGYPEIDNRYLQIYDNQLISSYLEQRLNESFPSKHWEVINAATDAYRIHQQLALIESVLLRYHPDYVLSMDGYNDVIALFNYARLSAGGDISDIYGNTPYGAEFNALANPGSFHSLFVFANAWLRANSALYQVLGDHLQRRFERSWEHRRVKMHRELRIPAQFSDLTPEEQIQFARALANVGYYTHVARQTYRILSLDGIQAVFLLQPELILTRKPLTDSENRLRDYDAKIGGPLYVYTFEQLYPVISRSMAEAARRNGFDFLDLQDVFDQTPEQVFSDFAHLTPGGNRIIAERVFQFMQKSFAETARAMR